MVTNMSYCVNCGVELDSSLKACPLCSTPVINPNQPYNPDEKSPFPTQKGQVEFVRRKDLGILISIVVLSTSLTCMLLNLLVFQSSLWSLIVIGPCIILWVLLIPFVIYSRLSVYMSLFFDALAISIYLFMLTFLTKSNRWFYQIALPIVFTSLVLVETITMLIKTVSTSILMCALYLFTAVPILCIGIECFVDHFLHGSILLTWSMIVLTVCVIIDIALITVLTRSRLRNAVRRRFHF